MSHIFAPILKPRQSITIGLCKNKNEKKGKGKQKQGKNKLDKHLSPSGEIDPHNLAEALFWPAQIKFSIAEIVVHGETPQCTVVL